MDNEMRYGLYGGSFDPVHIGHIAIAECAVRECGLDELIFMPAHVSPFKQDRKVTEGKDRCAMLEAILHRNKAFRLSDYELRKGGPSYTIETLSHFSETKAGELYFVLGFDSVVQLDKWYKGEEILRSFHLVCARRPDTDDGSGMRIIRDFRERYGADITVLGMEPVDASSTEVRGRVRDGRSITGLVPPEVEEYIIGHDLYKER